MQLNPEQLAVARACGCALLPATEDQVRRLRMQRRIFSVDGLPCVAAREGFLETHATLAALIEAHRPTVAEPGAEAGAAPAQKGAPRSAAEPTPAPAEPDAVPAQRRGAGAPSAKPRVRRPRPPTAVIDRPSTVETAAGRSEAEETLAAVAAAQSSASRARVPGRWRAGQPPTPRWVTAGKARRGRLK